MCCCCAWGNCLTGQWSALTRVSTNFPYHNGTFLFNSPRRNSWRSLLNLFWRSWCLQLQRCFKIKPFQVSPSWCSLHGGYCRTGRWKWCGSQDLKLHYQKEVIEGSILNSLCQELNWKRDVRVSNLATVKSCLLCLSKTEEIETWQARVYISITTRTETSLVTFLRREL